MGRETSLTVYTLFPNIGLFPSIGRADEFCMVRDWLSDKESPNRLTSKWKMPGGHVETGETPEEAAGKEVSEETGQRIKNPARRLCVIHKVPAGKEAAHHMIFFEGEPPLFRSVLKVGDEIAEARWMSADEIKRAIWTPDVVRTHAAAILWYFVRGPYLQTRNEELLRDVLSQLRYRSYAVDGETLVVCADENCGLCDGRILPPRLTARPVITLQPKREAESLAISPAAAPSMATSNAPDELNAGQSADKPVKAVAVLIRSTPFGEELLLKNGGQEFSIPATAIKEAGAAEQMNKWLGKDVDKFLLLGTHGYIIVAETKSVPAGFRAVDLNAQRPHHGISETDISAIKTGLKAWGRKNPERYRWLHYSWRDQIPGFDFREAAPAKPDKDGFSRKTAFAGRGRSRR